MSAQLMGLVRELKALNAKKKAGEVLTPEEEARRKELKIFLKSQLEGSDDGASGSAARPASSTAPPAAPPPSQPAIRAVEPPKPVPRPATMSAPPVTPPPPPKPAPPPPQAAPPKPAPPAFVPKKDAYAIAGASSFIDAAMSSDAVAKVDPWANRKAVASQGEIEDAEARADAALRATKKRERAVNPDEVEQQLREINEGASAYTPPADDFVLEQYYGDYFSEGLQFAPTEDAGDLRPIDPRELEVRRAVDLATGAAGATSAAVPAGLAFLDDFAALYAKRVLPPPGDDISVELEDPSLLIGKRKVTVHLLNGEKKQGSVRALRRGELGFKLENPGTAEEIAIAQVKAVFVHLQPNAQPKSAGGKALTVMFRDQRAVQGESPDYAPNAAVFTLIPPAGRGQFEKIVVNAAAVASVS